MNLVNFRFKLVAKLSFFGFLAVLIILAFPSITNAQEASLYLSPPTGVHEIGQPFTIRLLVDTDGEDINAAEGVLSYNPSDFEVVEISTEESIFSIWTTQPLLSDNGGISFGGGSSQAFSGDIGRIFSITLNPLRSGVGRITFNSGSVLAADGSGSNIISEMRTGAYTVVPSVEETAPEADFDPPPNSPQAPSINSSTHPSEDQWYKEGMVSLSWDAPADATATRVALNQRQSFVPDDFYDEPLEEMTFEDLEDGAWFFHIQFQNQYGWGEIGRFAVNIDSTVPEYFNVEKVVRDDPSNPHIEFIFDAFDATSGISYFEAIAGDGSTQRWDGDSRNFIFSNPAPGNNTLVLRAVDGAGNYLTDSVTFYVEPIEAPTLTEYPSVLSSGSILAVRGQTHPDAMVEIWMRRDGGQAEKFEVNSNQEGIFTFIAPNQPRDGIYTLWAEVTDQRGARSNPSSEITFAVRPPGFVSVGSTALSALSIIVPLVATVILLVILIIYGRHHVARFRKKLSKEVFEAEDIAHQAFTSLRSEYKDFIKLLKKASSNRELTAEEEAILEGLESRLEGNVGSSVEKEIKDIEEELKKGK